MTYITHSDSKCPRATSLRAGLDGVKLGSHSIRRLWSFLIANGPESAPPNVGAEIVTLEDRPRKTAWRLTDRRSLTLLEFVSA